MTFVNVVDAAVPILASQQQYDGETLVNSAHHAASLALQARLHREAQRDAAVLHQQELAFASQQFQKAVLVDTILAQRDASRGAMQQYSLVASSTVVVDVLLINGAFLIATQWNLPASSSTLRNTYQGERLVMALTCALGLSFLCSMVGIVCCIRMQRVMLQYDLTHSLKRYQPCGQLHSDFNKFFRCHGSVSWRWGTRSTALSVAFLMLAAVLLLFANYLWNASADTAGHDGDSQASTMSRSQLTASWVGFVTMAVCGGWSMLLFTAGNGIISSRTHLGPLEAVGLGEDSTIHLPME